MSRKDLFHEAVRNALEKDGWTITHDPYLLKFGEQKLQVDLGAEMPVAAEREGQKIAVEIKSFVSASTVTDLYAAIGQYMMYRTLMQKSEPERTLYLAVPNDAYYEVFDPAHGRDLRQELAVRLIVYEAEEETILQWIE
jgi:hypothetical protein